MKNQDPHDQRTGKPRISLEQKVKMLVRKYRVAERRRKRTMRVGSLPCRGFANAGAAREGDNRPMASRRYNRFPICAASLAVTLLLATAFLLAAQAANATPTFEQANAAFAAGNFRAAIAQYQAILAHDGYSAPVLFNLGNADYQAGQFGAAILNYERAQVLAPRDNSIATNLRLAREKTGAPAPAQNEIQQAARALSPNTLAWTGSFALAIICLTIGVRRFFPPFIYGNGIIGAAAITLLAAVAGYAIRWPDFNRAIVIAANAPARIAPAGTAAESFALRAGEPVTIQKSYGQFMLARTPGGRSGWVSQNEIGRVFVPRNGPPIPAKP